MRIRALLLTLMTVSIALAGCADEVEPEAEIQSKDDVVLSQTLGAIAGVVVDDRFRPLQVLEKAGGGEYQFDGFLLLQETGQRLFSNENGEFFAIDLEPGTYTLRSQIEGHEATPQRLSVKAGEFAEINIVARRTATDNTALVTDEYSAFLSCAEHLIILSFNIGCVPDSSGDTDRSSINADYTAYNGLTALVIELNMNQNARGGSAVDLVARQGLAEDYSSSVIFQGSWQKIHLFPGEITPDEAPVGTEHIVWNNDQAFQTTFFLRGQLSEEIREAYSPVYAVTKDIPNAYASASMRRGAGVHIGILGQFMFSAFLGEPDTNPLDYCVICPSG